MSTTRYCTDRRHLLAGASAGPGIQFNEKGQNDKLRISTVQNRGGKLVVVAPNTASNAKVEYPMTPYDKRG